LKEVAAAAGVSVAMASRVLSKYGSYSDSTMEKVEAAARSLDYRANGAARSLRLRRTHTIGVLVSQITSYYWTVFVSGIEETARQAGYHVILCNTTDDPDREMEYLTEMLEHGVDGIIASPLAQNHRAIKKLGATQLPVVLVNTRIAGSGLMQICSDDKQAAIDAVKYLGDLGHRRIGIVAGAQNIEAGRIRLDGYRAGIAALGLEQDESLVAFGNFLREGGYNATRTLLSQPKPPTAILIGSELMTGGALLLLKEFGVSIPHEISVLAFGDPDWATFFSPAISCLRAERFAMGQMACDSLITRIGTPDEGNRRTRLIRLRYELMQRESCGPPRTRSLRKCPPPDSAPTRTH